MSHAPSDNIPLRLRDAAKLAFPHGGMSARGLRKEAERGRLRIYRTNGQDFTTLGDIADMLKACVTVRATKVPNPIAPSVSGSLAAARNALDELA